MRHLQSKQPELVFLHSCFWKLWEEELSWTPLWGVTFWLTAYEGMLVLRGRFWVHKVQLVCLKHARDFNKVNMLINPVWLCSCFITVSTFCFWPFGTYSTHIAPDYIFFFIITTHHDPSPALCDVASVKLVHNKNMLRSQYSKFAVKGTVDV